MHFQMLSITQEHWALTTNNPELSDLVRRGHDDPSALADGEWDRFVDLAYKRFGIWEAAYLNRQAGTVADEAWQAWDGALRSTSVGPGFARFWQQERSGHAPSFQRYIDTKIFPGSEGDRS